MSSEVPLEHIKIKCEWKLKIKKEDTYETIKECQKDNLQDCEKLPECKQIYINNVDKNYKYIFELKIKNSQQIQTLKISNSNYYVINKF